jgi:hypothetical protein
MRSTLIRTAIIGLVAFAGATGPVLAQSHKVHAYQTAPYTGSDVEPGWQSSNVSAHPYAPSSVNNQPSACFTDEGYGRYASCDQAGY